MSIKKILCVGILYLNKNNTFCFPTLNNFFNNMLSLSSVNMQLCSLGLLRGLPYIGIAIMCLDILIYFKDNKENNNRFKLLLWLKATHILMVLINMFLPIPKMLFIFIPLMHYVVYFINYRWLLFSNKFYIAKTIAILYVLLYVVFFKAGIVIFDILALVAFVVSDCIYLLCKNKIADTDIDSDIDTDIGWHDHDYSPNAMNKTITWFLIEPVNNDDPNDRQIFHPSV